MAHVIQKLGRLALSTFKRDKRNAIEINKCAFEQLKEILDGITTADLHIDPALLQDRTVPDVAPVTYMQLFENQDLTICIFILKRGFRIPLHDHPEMFGLLKVVHGSVLIQSYSLLPEANPQPNIYTAVKHLQQAVTQQDPAISLTPETHNLHEICAVDGPAAFLDILAPPYGADIQQKTHRDCHYFEELKSDIAGTNCVWLARIPRTPIDFWCDSAEYKGPPIVGSSDCGKGH